MSGQSVAILLCTMNGEAYLQAQLDSFKAQSHVDWTLWVSDDGSTDNTLLILTRFKSDFPGEKVTIVTGPKQGFAANFLSLIMKTADAAAFYAYSDQDDIWQPNKLALAIEWQLRIDKQNIDKPNIDKHKPALYCTRSELIDEKGQHLGFSKIWPRRPGFQNALIQNIAGGNTMVFNRAAHQLLFQAGWQLDIVAHDWWTYLVVSGCGGEVFFDPTPTLQYRQHANNLIGANHQLTEPLRSVQRLIAGRLKRWNAQNIAALQSLYSNLPHENKEVLRIFTQARTAPLLARLGGVYRSGVYRQTFAGNLGLLLATLLRRI